MWMNLPLPIVIGHRGDMAFAPENTLASFQQAKNKGADAVEFDVKLTADGQVVVLHDQTVDRTTNGKGNVGRMNLAALKELDAGVQFPGQFPGEKIPTLEEVFNALGNNLFMNVELTNYFTPYDALVPKVADLVKKNNLQDRVIFSSFLAWNLHRAQKILPKVPCGLLTRPGIFGWWGRNIGWKGDFAALNAHLSDVTVELVDRIHTAGKQIIVWTVNQEEDILRLIKLKVDGIITNDPHKVLRLLGRSN